ncbi:hypothetical protein BCR37DRAFT_378024 [Protomyces lactucae-debilis]|uniref:Secreted protein n=1 Tax=Protomyces lactucae-debilis TaxID=2754530 RepID=A0A1Y2FM36_PROLT|nr:uncharacterized protein BCR37DRAFT_378024 [Protomyces lactucae-debilis]ORY85041.1 hypothetical protein BCR37DRAFT_378024 [Protomyces lactucae-debilis]
MMMESPGCWFASLTLRTLSLLILTRSTRSSASQAYAPWSCQASLPALVHTLVCWYAFSRFAQAFFAYTGTRCTVSSPSLHVLAATTSLPRY